LQSHDAADPPRDNAKAIVLNLVNQSGPVGAFKDRVGRQG
jgi:hypothetical protein